MTIFSLKAQADELTQVIIDYKLIYSLLALYEILIINKIKMMILFIQLIIYLFYCLLF